MNLAAVCFETHRGLCVNHREMLHLMNELQHPALRLNFDTGNILYYNENIHGEVALAKACHLVKHVHLKDTPGRMGDSVWKERATLVALSSFTPIKKLVGTDTLGTARVTAPPVVVRFWAGEV